MMQLKKPKEPRKMALFFLLQFCWVLHDENHSSTAMTDNKYIRVNTTKQNMQISVPYLKQLSITLVLLLMSCFTWLYKLILYFNHTALLNGKMQSWILLILPLRISLVILLVVSSKNLIVDQLPISLLIFFSILITCLLDIVLIL